jgi:hypothetical protein
MPVTRMHNLNQDPRRTNEDETIDSEDIHTPPTIALTHCILAALTSIFGGMGQFYTMYASLLSQYKQRTKIWVSVANVISFRHIS